MKAIQRFASSCVALGIALGAPILVNAQSIAAPMPEPRSVTSDEQLAINKTIFSHFQENVARDAEYYAAGQFRFVDHKYFHYFERTDLGSIAFENPLYGVSDKPLDPAVTTAAVLTPRIEESLKRSGLDTVGFKFARFLDEYAGAVQPAFVPKDFDPRKAAIHVARSALYERDIQGVPVFGSELLVGLMPDGSIGRMRYHAPGIDPKMLDQALSLQETVAGGLWKLPDSLRNGDTKVLKIEAGVAHSAFADPSFRASAVVRVLYRTASPNTEYPLQTTGYKYFDVNGNEVQLTLMPKMPETPASLKKGT